MRELKSGWIALLVLTMCLPRMSFSQASSPEVQRAKTIFTVPFVGCASDGQVGPRKAPRGRSKIVAISAEKAEKLAYYQAKEGFGVLAPRGWHCFGTYGSSGSNLYVAPARISSKDVLSSGWKGFTGPVIQLSVDIGDTSGRFGAAKAIARVFPAHMKFVQDVIAERIAPASSFPTGPFPADKLMYRSSEIVEFETAAKCDGLGTESWLLKNGDPIRGAAILVGQELSLVQVSVRLSPEVKDATNAIVKQVERDAAHSEN